MKNNFNLIRYSLAVFVLYSHSFGLLTLPEPSIFYSSLGNFAVKSFFALSGYFIALSLLRTNNLMFYIFNRALRILPALIIALILSRYIGNVFDNFIQNPVPYILNGPIWTLSWEIFCYLLLGLLSWYGIVNQKSLGALLSVSWLLMIVSPFSNETIQVIAPLIILFFSGAYIALNKDHINFTLIGPLSFIILVLIAYNPQGEFLQYFFNHIVYLYGPNFGINKYMQLIYLFLLPYSLLWLGSLGQFRILQWKNDYSYGIYIYAWPIQQIVINKTLPEGITPIVLFFTSWLFTHIVAMFSWHIIEKNMLKLKK